MTLEDDIRIQGLTDALCSLASLNFAVDAPILNDDSPLDGLAAAVNMMRDEIAAQIEQRVRDAERLRESEEQLRHAQKMEAIGRLAGGVAHDFNNLLSVILSYGELLLAEMRQDDPARGDVAEICNAGRRATSLTRQLLLFSRNQPPETSILDVSEVVEGMVKMLRRLAGEVVEVSWSCAGGLDPVRVDRSHLEQVVMNLAVNAADAMPSGGRLTLCGTNVEITEQTTIGLPPGPYVLLSVSDTGTGMDQGIQTRIFEPFFTTKERGRGTGLGLSTVFGIVRQAGGAVRVDSAPGRGTRFDLYFPRAHGERDPARAEIVVDGSVATYGHGTILLAEDEDALRGVLAAALRRSGYRVLEAKNGRDALSVAADPAHPIDVLITDVVMPELGGVELAQRLVAATPTLRVLYISGYNDEYAIDAERGGSLLQKPITPLVLVRAVRELLAKPPIAIAG